MNLQQLTGQILSRVDHNKASLDQSKAEFEIYLGTLMDEEERRHAAAVEAIQGHHKTMMTFLDAQLHAMNDVSVLVKGDPS